MWNSSSGWTSVAHIFFLHARAGGQWSDSSEEESYWLKISFLPSFRFWVSHPLQHHDLIKCFFPSWCLSSIEERVVLPTPWAGAGPQCNGTAVSWRTWKRKLTPAEKIQLKDAWLLEYQKKYNTILINVFSVLTLWVGFQPVSYLPDPMNSFPSQSEGTLPRYTDKQAVLNFIQAENFMECVVTVLVPRNKSHVPC